MPQPSSSGAAWRAPGPIERRTLPPRCAKPANTCSTRARGLAMRRLRRPWATDSGLSLLRLHGMFMRQPSPASRCSRVVDVPLVGVDVAAGAERMKHALEVQGVVLAGGADPDLANQLAALVGAQRELVAKIGLPCLLVQRASRSFWRRLGGDQSAGTALSSTMVDFSSLLSDCLRT